ncbi:MAG: DUF6625 family protein [Henriciella sp.]
MHKVRFQTNNRTIVIAIYFGRLPEYVTHWAATAAANDKFDWLLISDADNPFPDAPKNLTNMRCSRSEIEQLISDQTSVELPGAPPYKMCDYRPLFSMLVREIVADPDSYVYWGHADLDVVFGDIQKFVKKFQDQAYDRIFDLGHFSLYRNSPSINDAYKLASNPDWLTVLSNEKNFGFDEHNGINKVFNRLSTKFARTNTFAADISPYPNDDFVLLPPYLPRSGTRVRYDRGKLFLEWPNSRRREIAYCHFQKQIIRFSGQYNSSSFYLTKGPENDGGTPRSAERSSGKNKGLFINRYIFRSWINYIKQLVRAHSLRVARRVFGSEL